MRNAFILVISLFAFITQAYNGRLILNFDINHTMIATDAAAGSNLDEGIASIVAKEHRGIWAPNQKSPLSYYDYVKSSYPDKELRKKMLLQFVSSGLSPNAQEDFAHIRSKLTAQPTEVFSSFFQMIAYLNENNIKYNIVLRTFGSDLEATIKVLSTELRVTFATARFQNGKLILSSGIILQDPQKIFHYMSATPYLAIQDEYEPWHAAQEHWSAGKLFYLNDDEDRNNILPLFFDDNIEAAPAENNIVCPIHRISGEKIYPGAYYNKQLFKVETYQAIINDGYFINLVKQVLSYL